MFHNFRNYDCQLFFKKLVDKENDKIKYKTLPKTNEEYISVRNSCMGFIDSYRLLSSKLDSLVKTLVDNSHKTLQKWKEEIVDNYKISNIINQIGEEDKTSKYLKEDYPDEIDELEEALLKNELKF